MHLNKDLREFVELLNTNRVEYPIVAAIEAFGFRSLGAAVDDLNQPNKFV